jgi:hypothetical protein
MASNVLVAAVPETQITEFRERRRDWFEASRTVSASEILASWVTVSPLNLLLREAIRGGDTIREGLWHPFPPPTAHWTAPTRQLAQQLKDALDQAIREHGSPPPDDWYLVEISKLVTIFDHAATEGEAVIKFVTPPGIPDPPVLLVG